MEEMEEKEKLKVELKNLAEEFVDHPQVFTFISLVRGRCYLELLLNEYVGYCDYDVERANEIAKEWKKEKERRGIEEIHIRNVMRYEEFGGDPEIEAWASVVKFFKAEFLLPFEIRKEIIAHLSKCRECRKQLLVCIFGNLRVRYHLWEDRLKSAIREVFSFLNSSKLTI